LILSIGTVVHLFLILSCGLAVAELASFPSVESRNQNNSWQFTSYIQSASILYLNNGKYINFMHGSSDKKHLLLCLPAPKLTEQLVFQLKIQFCQIQKSTGCKNTKMPPLPPFWLMDGDPLPSAELSGAFTR